MISAVIVNHNGGPILLQTLDRLARLGSVVGEVIVADNGSTDGSRDDIKRRHRNILLLELGRNLGFGPANNRAVAFARGEYVLLLNSDAWPAAGALEKLEQALATNPRLALACPLLFYPDGRPQFHWATSTGLFGEAFQKLRNRWEKLPLIHRLPWPGGFYTAACVLVRKAAFDEIGGFDERFFLYFEDVDLCLRLRRAGWKLRTVPEAKAFHIKGASQRLQEGDVMPGELEYRRGQLAFYKKHRPAWELAWLRRHLKKKFLQREPGPGRDALFTLLGSP